MLIINSQPMASRNYELKRGVLLQAFGDASKTCTNDTITDELAEWYLKNQPEKIIYFSKLPPWYKVQNIPDPPPAKLFQRSSQRNFAQRNAPAVTEIIPPTTKMPKIVIIPPKVEEPVALIDNVLSEITEKKVVKRGKAKK